MGLGPWVRIDGNRHRRRSCGGTASRGRGQPGQGRAGCHPHARRREATVAGGGTVGTAGRRGCGPSCRSAPATGPANPASPTTAAPFHGRWEGAGGEGLPASRHHQFRPSPGHPSRDPRTSSSPSWVADTAGSLRESGELSAPSPMRRQPTGRVEPDVRRRASSRANAGWTPAEGDVYSMATDHRRARRPFRAPHS